MDSVIEIRESCALNSLWTVNMWDNATKTFIFKLHNNSLGYNLNVSKFVRGHSPLCTFCSLTRNLDDERETPLHLFFQCRHVEPVIEFIFRLVLGRDYNQMSRSDFFGGFKSENSNKNSSLLVVNTLVKKYIWPANKSGLQFSKDNLRFLIHTTSTFRRTWELSGIPLAF